MTNEFSKKYNPDLFEENIYKIWEETWKFKPRKSETWEQFYIPIPPPNVTWVLHLWHALTLTLEDIMVRYHRMKGDSTLWVPWTDHAWIATQARVENMLAKEWIRKEDLGREKFLEKVWEWKEKYGWTITSQIRKMWASCDWDKERFTLDEWLNKRVKKAFVELYNRWLIYKWEYMVNYSPALNTVLSDQEVIMKEEKAKLYYIIYFVSWSDNEVIVATTRPETMLWDVAVAVNPKDKRYKKLLKSWKKLILPILNKEIPLIADDMVDPEFGTWAVKITPAHDPNDFEVAKRHNLPLDQIVLWKDWRMTSAAWIFAWQDFMTARENIVELLKSKWNLFRVEDYNHKVGYCERSGCKVETIISTQWFVKVGPIAKKVIAWYKNKDFEIIPKRFNKIFEDWIYNLKDWCISRQLWWWHQIPAYYHKETWEMIVTEDDLSNDPNYIQDPDVLDTWFSSALWPFSILDYDMWGWKQPDLVKEFYPASMLETGHDIMFFWVIRMLLFWYEFTGQTPFKKVYFHWIVRDKFGRKMSKSLGNWIDPLDVIKEHWTDALRLTLSIWNTPWNDLKFDMDNVKNNKIFINKLWNATRFVYTNLFEKWNYKLDNYNEIEKRLLDNYESLEFHEKWILSRIRNISDLVRKSMENYSFSDAWIKLLAFTKNEFCDYYIEEFKLTKETSKYWNDVIIYVINNLLKLLHPYIPFVTEELYNKLWFKWMLIDEKFSKVALQASEKIEKNKELVIEVIKEIRRLRADNNIMPDKTIKLFIYAKKHNLELLEWVKDIISWIVKSENTEIVSKKPDTEWLVFGVIKSWVEVYVDTSNALDLNKEKERIESKIKDTKSYIAILDKKLLNESFVRKAPESLVRAEMEKKEQAKDKLKKLEEKLLRLNKYK